jgi:uncharacterized protein (DUF2267 family)
MWIDDEFIGAVEDRVGYSNGAWDVPKATDLIEAVIAVYQERLAKETYNPFATCTCGKALMHHTGRCDG